MEVSFQRECTALILGDFVDASTTHLDQNNHQDARESRLLGQLEGKSLLEFLLRQMMGFHSSIHPVLPEISPWSSFLRNPSHQKSEVSVFP